MIAKNLIEHGVSMGKVTFKGTPTQLEGNLPEVGKHVKDFVLVAADLSDKRLKDLIGKKVVLATVPSLDDRMFTIC